MGLASPIPPRTQPQGHARGHFVINSRSDAQKGLKCHQIGQATEGRLDVVHFGYLQWGGDGCPSPVATRDQRGLPSKVMPV
jgi:hypothetical protein